MGDFAVSSKENYFLRLGANRKVPEQRERGFEVEIAVEQPWIDLFRFSSPHSP